MNFFVRKYVEFEEDSIKLFDLKKFDCTDFIKFLSKIFFMISMNLLLKIVIFGIVSKYILSYFEPNFLLSCISLLLISLLVILSKFGKQCAEIAC